MRPDLWPDRPSHWLTLLVLGLILVFACTVYVVNSEQAFGTSEVAR